MKFYFKSKDAEYCYTLESIKEDMIEEGISEMTVFEAKTIKNTDMFNCRKFGEIGENGMCEKDCSCYKPKNKIKGCCVNRGSLYENTGVEKVIKVKL